MIKPGDVVQRWRAAWPTMHVEEGPIGLVISRSGSVCWVLWSDTFLEAKWEGNLFRVPFKEDA